MTKRRLRPYMWAAAAACVLVSTAGLGRAQSAVGLASANHAYAFGEAHVSVTHDDVSDLPVSVVHAPGMTRESRAGALQLPFAQGRLVIPSSAPITSVDVRGAGQWRKSLDHAPPRVPEQRPVSQPLHHAALGAWGRISTPPAAPSLKVTGDTELISSPIEAMWRGYRVLLFRLHPYRYDAQSGELIGVSEIEVTVHTSLRSMSGHDSTDASLATNDDDAAWLSDWVDNPGAVWQASVRTPTLDGLQGAADSGAPADLLIVTHGDLSGALQPLVDLRRAQGLEVMICHIEDVLSAGDPGIGDDASRLRDHIASVYVASLGTEHPLRYLLLAGDAEIIPARPMHVVAGIYETGPEVRLLSDAYYAGLDGSWDLDGDGLYGEGAKALGGTGEMGEEADLLPELSVGRVPLSLVAGPDPAAEARAWVAKALAYDAGLPDDLVRRGLWLGEQLDSQTFGGRSKELVVPSVSDLSITRLYDEAGVWAAPHVVSALHNAHVVNHLGHANVGHVLRMTSTDVDMLANAYPLVIHSQGCLAADFGAEGRDAIAEEFLISEHGAVAFIGNTSYGWYVPKGTGGASQYFDSELFDALFIEGIDRLGPALDDAKRDVLPIVGAVGPERWVWLELTLLGDPTMALARSAPGPRARFAHPVASAAVAGEVSLRGTASVPGGASGTYRVEVANSSEPNVWRVVATGQADGEEGDLGQWDTSTLPDGAYRLRVTCQATGGAQGFDELPVRVAHAGISAPAAGQFLRHGESVIVSGTAAYASPMTYTLDVGHGVTPSTWMTLTQSNLAVVEDALGAWRPDGPQGEYTLRLRLHGQGYASEERVVVAVDTDYAPGWPLDGVGARFSNESVAIGDITGDGVPEIVAAEGLKVCGGALDGGRCGMYGMRLHALSLDGVPLPGWPVLPGSDNRLTPPALADLDGDGVRDVVVGSIDGRVFAYDGAGALLRGWPQRVGDSVLASPACGDIDADGKTDVVACATDGTVHAWAGDGVPLRGWPALLDGSVQSPALGDLSGDGALEVVLVTDAGAVHVLRSDGTSLPGWPRTVADAFLAAPSLGDLDGDGQLEIVALSIGRPYVWEVDGSPCPGWSTAAPLSGSYGSSPALADLDDDGSLDVCYVDATGALAIRDGSGSDLTGGKAVHVGGLSSPIVADLDGDRDLEVITVGSDSDPRAYAYHHEGSMVDGWPKPVPDRETLYPTYWSRRSGLSVAASNAGSLMVGAVEESVLAWSIPQPAGSTWATYRGNVERTGLAASSAWRAALPLVAAGNGTY